jgi:hypothetical protein
MTQPNIAKFGLVPLASLALPALSVAGTHSHGEGKKSLCTPRLDC